MRKSTKGFTLIELVVVMAIIAILMVVLIGAIIAVRRSQANTTNRANANSIRVGLESHFSRFGAYCGAAPMQPCPTVGTTFQALGGTPDGVTPVVTGTLNTALGADAVNLGQSTANAANAGGGQVTALNAAGASAGMTLTPVDWNNAAMNAVIVP